MDKVSAAAASGANAVTCSFVRVVQRRAVERAVRVRQRRRIRAEQMGRPGAASQRSVERERRVPADQVPHRTGRPRGERTGAVDAIAVQAGATCEVGMASSSCAGSISTCRMRSRAAGTTTTSGSSVRCSASASIPCRCRTACRKAAASATSFAIRGRWTTTITAGTHARVQQPRWAIMRAIFRRVMRLEAACGRCSKTFRRLGRSAGRQASIDAWLPRDRPRGARHRGPVTRHPPTLHRRAAHAPPAARAIAT